MNLCTTESCLGYVNCGKTFATLWCTFHSPIISPFSISERRPLPRVFSFILGSIMWIEVVGRIAGLPSMISFRKYFCPSTVQCSTRGVETVFKKTAIACGRNPSKKVQFLRYAIAVFFKNASTQRVQYRTHTYHNLHSPKFRRRPRSTHLGQARQEGSENTGLPPCGVRTFSTGDKKVGSWTALASKSVGWHLYLKQVP